MKILKKAFVIAIVFALALCSVFSVFADSAVTTYASTDTNSIATASKKTYEYNGKTYVAERPEKATINTHTYYVCDRADGENGTGTKDDPFNNLYAAITYVQNEYGYLKYVDYDAEVIHEVRLVLTGDTLETELLPQIEGGILTITTELENPDDKVTVGVGSSLTITGKGSAIFAEYNGGSDFFKLVPDDDNRDKDGYIELNFGEPNMSGNIQFYCSNIRMGGNKFSFVTMGGNNTHTDENSWDTTKYPSNSSVIIFNMYDGTEITHIKTEKNGDGFKRNSTDAGNVIFVEYGTFNMYGGLISTNNVGVIVKSVNVTGAGSFIYGGEISNNFAHPFTAQYNGKIYIYDTLVKNNYRTSAGSAIGSGILYTNGNNTEIFVYGGSFIDNYVCAQGDFTLTGSSNDSAFAAAWTGKIYIATDNLNISNGKFSLPFTDMNGAEYEAGQTVYGTRQWGDNYMFSMKTIMFKQADGTVVVYGYTTAYEKNSKGKTEITMEFTDKVPSQLLKDGKLIRENFTSDSFTVNAANGEAIYTEYKAEYSCLDEFLEQIEITDTTDNAIYYIAKIPPHVLGNFKIVYPDGFDKEGYKSSTCTVCAEDIVVEEGLKPILVAKGYAVAKDGSAIMGGYKVDYDALNEFEDTNQTTLEYGVLFVNVNNETVDEITFENGVIKTSTILKAIQTRFNKDYTDEDGNPYESFNYKVSNFTPSEARYADLKIVIAAYVIEREKTESKTELGEIKNISFVQSNPASEENEETLAISDDAGEVDNKGFKYQKTVSVTGQNVKEGTTLGAVTLRNLYQNSEYAGTNDPFTKTED